jgi:hypothetical protein
MRLANGKLSVVISVANPKTLATIEGERDAIAGRLGGNQQELEDLTIRRQLDFAQGSNGKAGEDSSNKDSGQSNAQSGQSDSRRADGGSGRDSATSKATVAGHGGGAFTDFLV